MRNLPRDLARALHIEVNYQYESNGRLTIFVRVPDSDRQMTVELHREGRMSDDRLKTWSGAIATGRGFKDFVRILEEVLGVDIGESQGAAKIISSRPKRKKRG